MTIGRIPVIPTLVVLAAVAVMVRLGFWQLDRLDQKEALIERYAAAIENGEPVEFPVASQAAVEAALYRSSRINCAFTVGDWRSIAGRNSDGRAGYVHLILCGLDQASHPEDRNAWVQAGWSPGPTPPQWQGGEVIGRIAPNSDDFARLVADPPLADLEANATPDPNDLPNNHLAYAWQWFFFALTALLIYVLALRKRWR